MSGLRNKRTSILKMNIRTAHASIEKLESRGLKADANKLRHLIAETTAELQRRLKIAESAQA